MIRQSTIDKLHEMHLSAMSNAFEIQCSNPAAYEGLSFEDRFGMLVDKEWDKRKSTKLEKLIHSAGFRYPNACVEDIEYHSDRSLDKAQMLEFSTCRYISEGRHIILKVHLEMGKHMSHAHLALLHAETLLRSGMCVFRICLMNWQSPMVRVHLRRPLRHTSGLIF